MVTISTKAKLVTLINVFAVDPSRQDQLVQLLTTATQEVMSRLPGFVSASIHRSLDGKRVTNYAQWRDRAAFEDMLKNESAGSHMREAAKMAERFEPVLYDVASVHEAP